MDQKRFLVTPVLATMFAALALTACDNRDDATVGQQIDSSTQQAERAGDKAAGGMAEAGRDAKNATAEGVQNAGNAVSDAAITASVNAELAKDDQLSSLQIDVDTSNGRVALKGTAPNQAARDRATQLAQGVDGVTAVDNQLKVGGS